jgi:hypothetical protein
MGKKEQTACAHVLLDVYGFSLATADVC